MIMTKKEILKLHTLPENPLWDLLWKAGILHHHNESLADCAFRLRDEADIRRWWLTIKKLYKADKETCSDDAENWFISVQCTPIRWIQAALLAAQPQEGN